MANLVMSDSLSALSLAEAKIKRVLVTGADGYIGYVLAARLIEAGYEVDGVDTGFYQNAWLYHDGRDRPRVRCRDIRRITVEELKGYHAVIHLAELSNDPLCSFDENLTYEVNFRGSLSLAEKAKSAGVARFLYSSSCSVYGAAGNDPYKTETSSINPQTVYARCKILVEEAVAKLSDRDFAPTFLRNATAYGACPRMRFDIVLNNLAGIAWTEHVIRMTSDGTPWRPLVHISDIAEAFVSVLEAPQELVANEIFNVGDDAQNYRIRDIVEAVAEVFPIKSVEAGQNGGDNRSYRVCFQKIREKLPGFRCHWDIRSGAEELRQVFEAIGMTSDVFNAPAFSRLQQLKKLLDTEQVDAKLFWRSHALS